MKNRRRRQNQTNPQIRNLYILSAQKQRSILMKIMITIQIFKCQTSQALINHFMTMKPPILTLNFSLNFPKPFKPKLASSTNQTLGQLSILERKRLLKQIKITCALVGCCIYSFRASHLSGKILKARYLACWGNHFQHKILKIRNRVCKL